MDRLLFGTGGTPHSARARSSVAGIERLAELGLSCMELEFVHGVKMGEAGAREVRETASRLGITLTAHAPYYINLNARDEAKIKASQERLRQTAEVAVWCGAVSVAFHPAFYLGDPPEKAYPTIRTNLKEALEQMKGLSGQVRLRPEIGGKLSEFGGLEDTLKLCAELGLLPCLDFAHLHARSGQHNTYAEFAAILERVKEWLGGAALADIHIHVSGIAYSPKGEIKHLNLPESDFRYGEFLQALKDYRVRGTVICESPNLEADAQLLQATYRTR